MTKTIFGIIKKAKGRLDKVLDERSEKQPSRYEEIMKGLHEILEYELDGEEEGIIVHEMTVEVKKKIKYRDIGIIVNWWQNGMIWEADILFPGNWEIPSGKRAVVAEDKKRSYKIG